VNIGDVRIRAQSQPSINNTISATCTAKTFVYVEKAPEPPAAAAKSKRAKRGRR
jgi:hypothetical protein